MQSSSQIDTTNKPTPNFLQAGCPSCRPTNSVRALKEKALKEWNLIATLKLSMFHVGSFLQLFLRASDSVKEVMCRCYVSQYQ